MKRLKRRTFSGAVCEQIVFFASDRLQDTKKAEPRPRFKNEEERLAHRLGISKRKHAQLFNANFSPSSLYSTLTFDNENEVHTFQEARHLRDLFIKRLKYHFPDARLIVYMGRGKHTDRIHLHMVSDGIPKEEIVKQWYYGEIVRITHLREHNYYNGVDHGQDYTGLANYLFDHWTPEQGGHRYKPTRNLAKPEREDPTVAIVEYSLTRAPRPPKGYILVDAQATQYGYLYYKYVVAPPKKKPPLKE